MQAWRFPDPPVTTVLTFSPILAGKPVLFVRHDDEGHWYFFDRFDNTLVGCYELALVPLERLVALHPDLRELADIPAGWQAWRESAEQAWERESQRTLERTLARQRRLSEKMRREIVQLPPGSPSVVELIREMRGPI
jgi:hypothetical protein